VSGVVHAYVYDAEDISEERISGSSSDTIRYHHGPGIDEPLARTNASSVVTYYLGDHLGSVVQETSASGAVTLAREYGPWGELESGGSSSGYAFQGREWDSEIALFYFRARYYNAAAGAWASDDPIGFGGGPNFTQFVNNNPVRFVDPFGLCGEQNQLDKAYAQLARRKQPSVLDQATEDIQRRAGAMGEPDTYLQLLGVSVVGALTGLWTVGAEVAIAGEVMAWELAVKQVVLYEELVNALTALGPIGPVGYTVGEQLGTLGALIYDLAPKAYDKYIGSHYKQPDHWERLKRQ
jgi:RHS repeat-associated protein